METKAIISDVYGNLEALQAVLADIALHEVREIYCLGDIVGFGPNPGECVDLLCESKVAVLGDCDWVATGGTLQPEIREYLKIAWTRKQLEMPLPSAESAERRMKFLRGLPQTHREGDDLFVHASPRDPLNEYIFPEDIYNQRKMESIFASVERCCFFGHTGVPGIFTESCEFMPPADCGDEWRLGSGKVLCNVGSLGIPRDGDPRTGYVLFDGGTIRFRRIDYDYTITADKLKDIDGSQS